MAPAPERIRDRCRKETGDGRRAALSAVSLAELESGLHAGGRYEQKRPVLQRVLPPSEHSCFDPVDCVHHYGRFRAALDWAGKPIGPLDMLIAAHALAVDATLITHDTQEFQRVPGLKVED